MKQRKIISFFLTALMFSSCSNDMDNLKTKNEITFLESTSRIYTRAGNSGTMGGFRVNDKIGVFAHNDLDEYQNMCYALDNSNVNLQFIPVGNPGITYRYSDESYQVSAYFPYKGNLSENGFTVSTKNQSHFLDIKYAEPYTMSNHGYPDNSFLFKHKMAMIKLILKGGNHQSTAAVKNNSTVWISNLKHLGTFNPRIGGRIVPKSYASRENDVLAFTFTPTLTADSKIMNLYYIPQDLPSDMVLKVRVYSTEYHVTLHVSDSDGSGKSLKEGYVYEFEITL